MPGKKKPRLCSSFFVDCSGACFANFPEPRSDLRREQPAQLQILIGAFEPVPLASTVRAPTQTRRTETNEKALGENLENVITLVPVGNQIVGGLLALEGGDAGGASCELPNTGGIDDGTR